MVPLTLCSPHRAATGLYILRETKGFRAFCPPLDTGATPRVIQLTTYDQRSTDRSDFEIFSPV
jgi:hypothetical protein